MTHVNRYIILGSGIAGMAAAEAIRSRDPQGSVQMVSAEKELCFNRPMLIREFALDGSGSVLFEKQQDWPKQFDVDVHLQTRAEKIDTKGKRVLLTHTGDRACRGCAGEDAGADAETSGESGRWESYDKLIYALGAEVTIPPIPGADLPHVHVVRTREDMRRIREAMRKARHAVVIGGGMLGLEDAWGLREEKLDVAIIEQRQRVAFGQIDQSAGNLMKKRIERMGVPVYVNATVEEIGEGYVTFRQPVQDDPAAPLSAEPNSGDPADGCPADKSPCGDKASGCETCPGCDGCFLQTPAAEMVTIPADLVILSTGVTPNSELGKAAGLAVTSQPAAGGTKAAPADQPAAGEKDSLPADAKGGEDGGNRCWIAVDEHCRTSDPDIYAAGDAAAVNGRNDAIWDEAREMGRVAGTNAAMALKDVTMASARPGTTADARGCAATEPPVSTSATSVPETYTPVVAEHVFTGFDTEVFTLADSSGAGTDGVYIRHADVEIFDYQRERYIRVSLQDGIIAGVLLINAPELAPELIQAYQQRGGEDEARRIIQQWKESHEVDFKPAAGFRRR